MPWLGGNMGSCQSMFQRRTCTGNEYSASARAITFQHQQYWMLPIRPRVGPESLSVYGFKRCTVTLLGCIRSSTITLTVEVTLCTVRTSQNRRGRRLLYWQFIDDKIGKVPFVALLRYKFGNAVDSLTKEHRLRDWWSCDIGTVHRKEEEQGIPIQWRYSN